MKRETMRRVQREIERLAEQGLDWVRLAARVGDVLREVVPYERACWHPVDPGTYLFTGSISHNMFCSGPWLARHEYELDDLNKWHDLARAERRAASLVGATGGDLSRSARARSSAEYGLPIADELRVALVADGTYWAAAGFIRSDGQPFAEEEVELLGLLSAPIADGFRRAMLARHVRPTRGDEVAEETAGLVILDEQGGLASISPEADRLIARMVETPPPAQPHEARAIQAVAARARSLRDEPTNGPPPRARVRTQDGGWLQLYATTLAGEREGHVAVVVQPAALRDVAPLVARAYGLSPAERRIARLCLEGHGTRAIAELLGITEYTVQDHLKAIFRKTGARSRGQLVGQVFLEHYVPRFEGVDGLSGDWSAEAIHPEPEASKRGP